ncbi:hypothetical protein QE152_g5833 [Popillia japonica]|uniref:Uncharacterized protein n=1 Tax=Popillia japonica TaxID=7064 RepID=A0AAW1MNN1_POPJA
MFSSFKARAKNFMNSVVSCVCHEHYRANKPIKVIETTFAVIANPSAAIISKKTVSYYLPRHCITIYNSKQAHFYRFRINQVGVQSTGTQPRNVACDRSVFFSVLLFTFEIQLASDYRKPMIGMVIIFQAILLAAT